MMSLLSVLATIVGSVTGLSNFPQAFKIFKRKSARDISPITLIMLFIGIAVWLLYGIEIKNMPIIICNFFGIVGITFVIIGWFLYGRD